MSHLLHKVNAGGALVDAGIAGPARWVGDASAAPITSAQAVTAVVTAGIGAGVGEGVGAGENLGTSDETQAALDEYNAQHEGE